MTIIMSILQTSKRVVIKIGTSLIMDNEISVRSAWLATLASDIAALITEGKQVLVVTSGAVGLGRQVMGYGARTLKLEEKQAAAACGQITLFSEWEKALRNADAKLRTAQVLLTIDDSENRRRYLNARSTLETLLSEPHIIPIINENDTVATTELRIGDNDRLAARVAQMVGANLLILFSDVDGLYDANPAIDASATLLESIKQVTPEIEAMAGGIGTAIASGGMKTKIDAAKIALAAGCHMVIAGGKKDHPLKQLQGGGAHSHFIAQSTPKAARKHWINGSIRANGTIYLDEGAVAALQAGKSLLPAGVKKIEGDFERGDAVTIKSESGVTLGKGLSAYSSADAAKIAGHKSAEIEQILGFKGRDTLIHRDDMVLE